MEEVCIRWNVYLIKAPACLLCRPRGQREPLLRLLPRHLGSLRGGGEERGGSGQQPRQLQGLHLRARVLSAAHVPVRIHLQERLQSARAGREEGRL